MKNNCQHFAKEMFCKFAKFKTWEPTTISDVTSPVNLFNHGSAPLLLILLFFAFSGDIYFLTTYYHYKVAATVVLIYVVLRTISTYIGVGEVLAGYFYFIMLIVFPLLLLADVFGWQSSFLRKRGTLYCEYTEWSNSFCKFLAPLCYGTIYLVPAFAYYIILPAWVILNVAISRSSWVLLEDVRNKFESFFIISLVYFLSFGLSIVYFTFFC